MAASQLKKDIKKFFESIDACSEGRSSHNNNRVILEQRLRATVGLTMPPQRYK